MQSDDQPNNQTNQQPRDENERSGVISIYALLIGVLALTLVIFPELAQDRSSPVPFAEDGTAAEEPEVTGTPTTIRVFRMIATAVGLAGIVVAMIGQWKEKHTALTIGSIGCATVAITWQYIVIGLAAGAGAVAFLVILFILSQLG